jgi:hypothetical protein
MIASIFENSTETASLAMQYWLSRAFGRQAVAILDAAKRRSPECFSMNAEWKVRQMPPRLWLPKIYTLHSAIHFIWCTVIDEVLSFCLYNYRSMSFPWKSSWEMKKIQEVSVD